MTESTYNLSRKESKRWQNVNTQLLIILTVGIYRTHLYLLRFFHPFNPYNPCSFHHWVFCRTRIYKIDTDGSLLLDFVGWCSLCTLRAESPTANKGRIRQNPASDRRYEIFYRSNSKEHPWKNKSVASALSVIDFERGERAKGEWAHLMGYCLPN